MMSRRARIAALLGLLAAALPAVLLAPRLAPPPLPEPAPPEPIDWRVPPALSAALTRPLFAGDPVSAPADAPELIGIVGRLDRDAVAMVRGRDGTVRTLRPGEGVDGWQLRSLAFDAAYFTRGAQQARVALSGE